MEDDNSKSYANDDSTDVFMFTGDKREDGTSPEKQKAFDLKKPTPDNPAEYIITGYNLENEEEIKMAKTKLEMLKNINSKQVELQNLSIFQHLCPPEKYRKDGVCYITGKKDSLSNCPFCGKVVHKSVLERRRKDPQNPDNFVKICDRCNKNYLERQLLLPFWKNCQKIRVVVEDREKNYDKYLTKVNKLDTEIVNIRKLNGAKETDVVQRHAKLESDTKEYTSNLELLNEEMEDLTKRLGRIDNEYFQAEILTKEQRIHYQKLEKQLRDINQEDEKIEKENKANLEKMKQYEYPLQIRQSHLPMNLNKRGMGDSVFTNRIPTVILQNKTIIGSKSVIDAKSFGGAGGVKKNQQVSSSRGFCSMFGLFGGSGGQKTKSTKDLIRDSKSKK